MSFIRKEFLIRKEFSKLGKLMAYSCLLSYDLYPALIDASCSSHRVTASFLDSQKQEAPAVARMTVLTVITLLSEQYS